MKKGFVTAAAMAILLGSGAAFAEEKRTQFIDFGEQLINGDTKRPAATMIEGRERPVFGPLSKLPKSFLPALLETGKSPSLK